MSKEVLQAKGNLMKSIKTFLEKFNCISFGEMPKVLLQAWEKFFEIQLAQPVDTNELLQKLLEDLQIVNEELAEYINSPSWNRPTFYNNDEEHSIQYKEYLENSPNAIVASNFNQEKENSDIRQLTREECGINVCEEQKPNMEDTMLELLEKKQKVKNIVEQPTKRGTCITESLQNFRVIHKKSSTSLNNTSQISPVNAIAPVLPTEEPEWSLSMGYEHLSTISEMESDEVIKSSVKNLVQIPREYEVTSDNESECDVLVCEDSFDVLKDHSEILSDSNNDDTSSDDDAFEDIEYVEASLLDSELVSLKEENDVYQEEKEIDLEDILQIQDVILREKLLSINRLIADIEFLNDNPTPDRVLKYSSSFSIFEKSDNSLSYSDNSLPEFETFSDHTKETRSGSTTAHANNFPPEYDSFCFEIEPDQGRLTNVVMNDISDNSTNDPLLEEVDLFLVSDNSIPSGIENIDYDSEGDIHFLEELIVNDSISFPENDSSNFDHHDDPSFPRPPPKPPDVEIFFEPDSGVVITNVVKDSFEHYVFMPNILPTLPTLWSNFDILLPFSSENEDNVFKPGILSSLPVSHRDKTTSDFSENPMMMYGGDIPLLDVLDLHTIPMDK
uniref:Reverse transcriptase domain-containing protein n=1 Tax=Tanacetum cinerariifolium TaxID=118510 RepID=A0A6L2MZK1_TANCI|nr:hypothetical protein [Tanacetum cinerariifolium]